MADSGRSKVLCVDDYAPFLESLRLLLTPRYEVLTALNAAEGLRVLSAEDGVVAIISDMCMPGMDGATFLARTRQCTPHAGRILLTAETNLQSAVATVNEAQILRFLSKPCKPEDLYAAIDAAIEHQRLSSLENTGLRRAITAQITSQDPTTGLASRKRFTEMLEAACADAEGKDRTSSFAVLIINIENLRDITAAQSHTAGDQVLQALARRLREHCSGALCIARWGDDEFAVLLPSDLSDEGAVLTAADALIGKLTYPIPLQQSAQRVRACIGIAGVPVHTGDATTALKFANIAARHAKLQGGGMACLFRSDWAQRAAYRQQLFVALREAIETDALRVNYQPVVDLKAGTVPTLEALARWTHPTLGPIAPAQFISLAEESGEMPRLGEWILRRVCRDARALAGRYCARVAVNVSMHQLLHDGFLAHLDEALCAARLHPQELEIELTESVLASDAERSLALVTELRRRGVAVAIDDFGTGYSSLAYLQRFPADVLKVDRSFVTALGHGGETIISAALSIGRSFGMKVVIEGVETQMARRQLSALGATLFQGYLFARPMPTAGIDQWFLNSPFAAAPSQVPASADAVETAPGLAAMAGHSL
ncbi:MAG: GGDEF/EAL domain-containing response regulator [Steroidobacteraceae bacterium]